MPSRNIPVLAPRANTGRRAPLLRSVQVNPTPAMLVPPGFPAADRRLIVTIGLHGSASTWVYNIVRELMIARHGPDEVVAMFAQDVAELLEDRGLAARHIVCKTHHGGPQWEEFDRACRPTVLLSVRDPRDATVSMSCRFGVDLKQAALIIAPDCARAIECADAGHQVLRYEDRFFDDPATVAIIASLICAEASAAVQGRIFESYRTAAVRAFAADLDALPAERRAGGDELPHDRVPQIHRTQIGDGRVGKWRDLLPAAWQPSFTALFAPFLARFGYSA